MRTKFILKKNTQLTFIRIIVDTFLSRPKLSRWTLAHLIQTLQAQNKLIAFICFARRVRATVLIETLVFFFLHSIFIIAIIELIAIFRIKFLTTSIRYPIVSSWASFFFDEIKFSLYFSQKIFELFSYWHVEDTQLKPFENN